MKFNREKLMEIAKPRSEKAIKKAEERKRKRTAKSELDRAVERYVEGDPEGAQKVISRVAFEFGAKWGIEHAINKACEWLRTHSEADYFELISVGNYCGAGNLNKKKMIEDFKKYMEE